jgi:hypothetical protein
MEGLAGVTNSFLLAGIMNIIVDCVMTFFGSTSNDACFNAHVTEITNEHNRPKVEAILSVLPLFAVAAMLGIGGLLGVPTTIKEKTKTPLLLRIAPLSPGSSSSWSLVRLSP